MKSVTALIVLGCFWLATAAKAQPADPAPQTSDTGLDPHQQLRVILHQPIYQRWQLRQERRSTDSSQHGPPWWSTYVASWFQHANDAVGRFIDWLLGQTRHARLPSWGPHASYTVAVMKTVAWAVLAGVCVFMAVVLYRAWVGSQDPQGTTRVLSREKIERAMEEGQALALDGKAWLEQAMRLSQEGDFRAVYRALYLALLSGLHAQGRIDFRPCRTNWTYVTRFTGSDEQRGQFGQLTTLFDDTWYGLKTATGTDIESVRQRVSRLIGVTVDER